MQFSIVFIFKAVKKSCHVDHLVNALKFTFTSHLYIKNSEYRNIVNQLTRPLPDKRQKVYDKIDDFDI